MPIPSDYKELLKTLNRHRVRYLIVGAYAVIHYTEPRYTKDLDIWIDTRDAKRAYGALKEFGAPLKDIKVEDFANKSLVYQIGVEPIRVDIIMGIPNLEFKHAWEHRKIARFEGITVNIIGINELIKSKRRANRHMDIVDIENLRRRQRLKTQKYE